MVDTVSYQEFSERLRATMEKTETSITKLAQIAEVTYEMVRRYSIGTAMPRQKTLIKISNYLCVSPAWLLWGGPDHDKIEFVGIREEQAQYQAVQQQNIKIVGRAKFVDEEFTDIEPPDENKGNHIIWASKDKNAYAIECVGGSMRPRIQPREFIIVEPSTEYTNGDEVIVRDKKGRVIVKKYLYTRDGKIHLYSVNEAHRPIDIDVELIDRIHKVAGVAPQSLCVLII